METQLVEVHYLGADGSPKVMEINCRLGWIARPTAIEGAIVGLMTWQKGHHKVVIDLRDGRPREEAPRVAEIVSAIKKKAEELKRAATPSFHEVLSDLVPNFEEGEVVFKVWGKEAEEAVRSFGNRKKVPYEVVVLPTDGYDTPSEGSRHPTVWVRQEHQEKMKLLVEKRFREDARPTYQTVKGTDDLPDRIREAISRRHSQNVGGGGFLGVSKVPGSGGHWE